MSWAIVLFGLSFAGVLTVPIMDVHG